MLDTGDTAIVITTCKCRIPWGPFPWDLQRRVFRSPPRLELHLKWNKTITLAMLCLFMIHMINTCLSKTATKCNYMHFIVHMMHTHWIEVFRVQYQNMQIYKSHSECIRIIPTLF